MINTLNLQDNFETQLSEASNRSRARLDQALARRRDLARDQVTIEETTIRELLDREGPGSLMDDIRNARDLDRGELEKLSREHIRLRER